MFKQHYWYPTLYQNTFTTKDPLDKTTITQEKRQLILDNTKDPESRLYELNNLVTYKTTFQTLTIGSFKAAIVSNDYLMLHTISVEFESSFKAVRKMAAAAFINSLLAVNQVVVFNPTLVGLIDDGDLKTLSDMGLKYNLRFSIDCADITHYIHNSVLNNELYTKWKEGGFNPYGNEMLLNSSFYLEFPDYEVYTKNYILPAGNNKIFVMNTEPSYQYNITLKCDLQGDYSVIFSGLALGDLTNATLSRYGALQPPSPYPIHGLHSGDFQSTTRFLADSGLDLWLVSCSSHMTMYSLTIRRRKEGVASVTDYYGGSGTNPPISFVPAPPLLGGFNEYGNEQIYYDPILMRWFSDDDINSFKGIGYRSNKNYKPETRFIDFFSLYCCEHDPIDDVDNKKSEVIHNQTKENGDKNANKTESNAMQTKSLENRAAKRQQFFQKREAAVARMSKHYSQFVDLLVDYIECRISKYTIMNYVNVLRDGLKTDQQHEVDWLKQDNTRNFSSFYRFLPKVAKGNLTDVIASCPSESTRTIMTKLSGFYPNKDVEFVQPYTLEEVAEIKKQIEADGPLSEHNLPPMTIEQVRQQAQAKVEKDTAYCIPIVQRYQPKKLYEESSDEYKPKFMFGDVAVNVNNSSTMVVKDVPAAPVYGVKDEDGNRNGSYRDVTPGNPDEKGMWTDFSYHPVPYSYDEWVNKGLYSDDINFELIRDNYTDLNGNLDKAGYDAAVDRIFRGEYDKYIQDWYLGERTKSISPEQRINRSRKQLGQDPVTLIVDDNSPIGSIGPGRVQNSLSTSNIENYAAYLHDRYYSKGDPQAAADTLKVVPDSWIMRSLYWLKTFGNYMTEPIPKFFDSSKKVDLKRFEGSYNPYGNGQTHSFISENFGSKSFSEIVDNYLNKYLVSTTSQDTYSLFTSWLNQLKVSTRIGNTDYVIGTDHRFSNTYHPTVRVSLQLNPIVHNVVPPLFIRLGVKAALDVDLVPTIRTTQVINAMKTSIDDFTRLGSGNNRLADPSFVYTLQQFLPNLTARGIRPALIDALLRRIDTRTFISHQSTYTNIDLVRGNPANDAYFNNALQAVNAPYHFPFRPGAAVNSVRARYMTPTALASSLQNNAFTQDPNIPNATRTLNDDIECIIPFDDSMTGREPGALAYYIMCFLEYPLFCKSFEMLTNIVDNPGAGLALQTSALANMLAIEGPIHPIFCYSDTQALANVNYQVINLTTIGNVVAPLVLSAGNHEWGSGASLDILPYLSWWFNYFLTHPVEKRISAQVARTWLIKFKIIDPEDILIAERLAGVYSWRTTERTNVTFGKPVTGDQYSLSNPAATGWTDVLTGMTVLSCTQVQDAITHWSEQPYYTADFVRASTFANMIAGNHCGTVIPRLYCYGNLFTAWNMVDRKLTSLFVPPLSDCSAQQVFDWVINTTTSYNMSYWPIKTKLPINLLCRSTAGADNPYIQGNASMAVAYRRFNDSLSSKRQNLWSSMNSSSWPECYPIIYPTLTFTFQPTAPDTLCSNWNICLLYGKMDERVKNSSFSDRISFSSENSDLVFLYENAGQYTWRFKIKAAEDLVTYLAQSDWDFVHPVGALPLTDTVSPDNNIKVAISWITRDTTSSLFYAVTRRVNFMYCPAIGSYSYGTYLPKLLTLNSPNYDSFSQTVQPWRFNVNEPMIFSNFPVLSPPSNQNYVDTPSLFESSVKTTLAQANNERDRAEADKMNANTTTNVSAVYEPSVNLNIANV